MIYQNKLKNSYCLQTEGVIEIRNIMKFNYITNQGGRQK